MNRIYITGDVFKHVQKINALFIRKGYGREDIFSAIHYEFNSHSFRAVTTSGFALCVLRGPCRYDSLEPITLDAHPIDVPRGCFQVEIDPESKVAFFTGLASTSVTLPTFRTEFMNYQLILDKCREKMLGRRSIELEGAIDCFDPAQIENAAKAFRMAGIERMTVFTPADNLNATILHGMNDEYMLTIAVMPVRNSNLKDIEF